jgi:hypothetical protein
MARSIYGVNALLRDGKNRSRRRITGYSINSDIMMPKTMEPAK